MKKFRILIFFICLFLPLTFSGCENARQKTLSTPNNLEVETNGIISFDMVNGASYYTISINNVTLNVFPNADENNQVERVDNTLFYDASRIFVLGKTYEVKVSARGNDKKSKYTETVSYVHAINVEQAKNVKFNGTILTWDAVEHASYYVIKVVAPYDYVEDESPTGIASADLTEYHFSTNRFDFSSLTTTAGKYKFFINAVSLENNVLQSGYTYAKIYEHKINLSTPNNKGIVKINKYDKDTNEIVETFHLQTIIDDYTNALNIKIGNDTKTVYLDGNDTNVEIGNNYAGVQNVVDVNLSKLFKDTVNLSNLYSFQTQVQAIYVTTADENFYISSSYSAEVDTQNLKALEAPSTKLNLDNSTGIYELTWEVENPSNVSGFTVLIKTTEGIKSVDVSAETNSMLMPQNFEHAWVQAKGKGSYTISKLSDVATALTVKENTGLSLSVKNDVLTWNRKDNLPFTNTRFIVQINEEVRITSNSAVNISTIQNKIESLSITILKDGFAPTVVNCSVDILSRTLNMPNELKFNAQSLYVLSFIGDSNAMGYYIYLNGNRVEKLFTSTTINLAPYITNSKYEVKVQAVANKFSAFKDSQISAGIMVTHQQSLEKPAFILNETGSPITKVKEGNQNKYYLNFNGVTGASSYEILVNFNSLSDTSSGMGKHVVDITNLIVSAGKYTVMVRALPNENATNIKPSEYAIFDDCIITQQLESVSNVKVSDNDGKYTLTFDTQANAVDYSVRILKVNDSNYSIYLSEQSALLGIDLSNPFKTKGACDITEYLKQEGEYRVYVTALAPENSYYANSDESKEFAELNKRKSLATPENFRYHNRSKEEFNVAWIADENADYFLVNVVDANNISYEFKVLNTSANYVSFEGVEYVRCNINSCLTSQGLYKIRVKALVNSNGETSATHADSPFSDYDEITYTLTYDQDFERNDMFINGETYNNLIDDVNELKNVLWYNYLYEINYQYRLRIKLNKQLKVNQGEGSAELETTKELLIRYANDATASGLYDFSKDEQWNTTIQSGSNTDILAVLCDKLINLYPEMHLLKGLNVHVLSGQDDKFQIYYENALNAEKVDNQDNLYLADDYGNKFAYLNENARRGSNTVFAIDLATETMPVTTTEQLLHAIQYGKRPVFVGDSEVAEQVYANAKAVLIATTNNNMTDLEKTTAIFDWINYAINLNYKSNYYLNDQNVSVEANELQIAEYGLRKEFYLEGVFLDLFNEANGGSDGEFYLGNKSGTSESYAKAFTLLCGIEGIETRKVNGSYTLIEAGDKQTTKRHTWNKVKLKVSESAEYAWFMVDAMFSDSASVITGSANNQLDVPYASSISSHLFYLITETRDIKDIAKVASFLDVGSSSSNPSQISIHVNKNDPTYNNTTYICNTGYDYYEFAEFSIKKADSPYIAYVQNATYTKHYNILEQYNAYNGGGTSTSLQTYIKNLLVDAYKNLKANGTNRATLEFKFNHVDNNNLALISNLNNTIQEFNNNVLYTSQPDVTLNQTIIKQEEKSTIYVLTLNVPSN